MISAGNSQDSTEKTEIASVACIVGKRKYVDWSKHQPVNIDFSTNRTEADGGPYEYLIEWQDGEMTWELVRPNLLNIKEMLRVFDN